MAKQHENKSILFVRACAGRARCSCCNTACSEQWTGILTTSEPRDSSRLFLKPDKQLPRYPEHRFATLMCDKLDLSLEVFPGRSTRTTLWTATTAEC